jgi:hypothetical protein
MGQEQMKSSENRLRKRTEEMRNESYIVMINTIMGTNYRNPN